MKCQNCVIGDLQLTFRGEVRFTTDVHGRPIGEAELNTREGEFSMVCDTCSDTRVVAGWASDGSGRVLLAEEAPLGVEPQGGSR